MKKDDPVSQPDEVWKSLLGDVMNAEPSEFVFRGKKRRLGWLHKRTYQKFERVMVSEEDSWKRNVKLASLILMNVRSGFWSMLRTNLWHPLYWRWLYYVCDVDMSDVLSVLDASKKKIPSAPLLLSTTLATALMDEMVGMTLTKKEAKATRAAHSGASSSH